MGCGSSSDVLSMPENPQALFENALQSTALGDNLENAITSKVDVNMKIESDVLGFCHPIHIACKAGNVKAVTALIKCGADLSLKDGKGQTALHWAIHESHIDVIDELLQGEADVNARSDDNMSPIEAAIKESNIDVVKKLLEHKPDLTNDESDCPLKIAAVQNKPYIVEVLLKANAPPNNVKVPSDNGEIDLWQWATNGNYEEVIILLGSSNTTVNSTPKEEEKAEEPIREGGDGKEADNTKEPPVETEKEGPPETEATNEIPAKEDPPQETEKVDPPAQEDGNAAGDSSPAETTEPDPPADEV